MTHCSLHDGTSARKLAQLRREMVRTLEIDVHDSQTRFPRSCRRLAASSGSAVTCAKNISATDGITRVSPFTILCERSFLADSFFIADYSSRHLYHRNSTPTAYHCRCNRLPVLCRDTRLQPGRLQDSVSTTLVCLGYRQRLSHRLWS